jgi:hypothetical protein
VRFCAASFLDELLISVDGILSQDDRCLYRRLVERTKGTADLEVHLTTSPVDQGSRHQDRFRSTRKEGALTQVGRALVAVVNEDGSNTVCKCEAGAEITVTRAKGLLKRINSKIVRNRG